MRQELPHFTIGPEYGANQELYKDAWMRNGGCAATCACESALLFKKYHGIESAYPYEVDEIRRDVFESFAMQMKPYLRPRMSGIDKLSIYEEGFLAYLADQGIDFIKMDELDGDAPYEEAEKAVRAQIDCGIVVPALTLRHRDEAMKEYFWHWYLINGYDDTQETFMVKAATCGEWEWVSFARLWDTGYTRKGGLILYQLQREEDASHTGQSAGCEGIEQGTSAEG